MSDNIDVCTKQLDFTKEEVTKNDLAIHNICYS